MKGAKATTTVRVYGSIEEMKADEHNRESTPEEKRVFESYLEWLKAEKLKASESSRES